MLSQKVQSRIIKTIILVCGILTGLISAGIVIYILIRGIPHINLDLFSVKYTSENSSLFPALINTLVMTLLTLVIAIPVGFGAAVYLAEYAKQDSKIVKVIRITTETLSGIPSIVYGLFGFLFFVTFCGWGYSTIAGCCTLAIMILPIIERTTEEALLSVDNSFREGSYGLGAGKFRTIFKIVFPVAAPGIISGIVLSVGRIVGETAALIYTAGTVAKVAGPMESGRTLAVHLYALWSEGLATEQSYATAVILVIIVVLLNALTSFLEKKFVKRTK